MRNFFTNDKICFIFKKMENKFSYLKRLFSWTTINGEKNKMVDNVGRARVVSTIGLLTIGLRATQPSLSSETYFIIHIYMAELIRQLGLAILKHIYTTSAIKNAP